MQRLATTMALASWFGFLMVTAGMSASEALAPLGFERLGLQLGPRPGPERAETAEAWLASGASLALLALAMCLGRALVLLQGADRDRRRIGERYGLVGLALTGAVGAASRLTDLGLVPSSTVGGMFWLLLAGSALAVLFDRLVAVDPDEADDHSAFEAGVAAIAQGMARQTNLYASNSLKNGTSAP